MRFTSICLAFLLPVAFASSIPQVVQDGVDQVRFTFSDDNDPCPDFLVRCIKDSEVVGDVSSLSFEPVPHLDEPASFASFLSSY